MQNVHAQQQNRPGGIRFRRQAARLISTVCNPFLTTLILFVLFSHGLASSTADFWRLLAITSFFTAIGPMLFVYWCYATDRISDLDMSVRSEREAIFGVFVAFYLAGTCALALLHAPALLIASMAGYTANTFIVGIITRYWKISTHALGITAPLVALWVMYKPAPLPFFILIPLVAWARVYLKAHTIAQVVAGTALAAITVIVFFKVYHVA
jgi:membrane-associated phospholipid phosphatase